MSDVKRYTFKGAAGRYVYEADFDRAQAQRDAILVQARVWSGEAKAQRNTVNEVGSVLGGIPDWGPIAAKVGDLVTRLNVSEQRVDDLQTDLAAACELLKHGSLPTPAHCESVLDFLAGQSAPAAKPHE
jgi:hypothetical protein